MKPVEIEGPPPRGRAESSFVVSNPLAARVLGLCGTGGKSTSAALAGTLMVLLSTLGFSSCALFVSLLSRHGVPSFQATTARFVGQAVCSILAMAFTKRNTPKELMTLSCWIGKPENRMLLFNRAFWGGLAMSSYFAALGLPGANFSDVVCIVFLNVPLTTVLAAVLVKEPYTWLDGFTSALCLVGVVFVVQPESLFGSSTPTGETPQPVSLLVIGVSLFAAVASSAAYLSIKKIGNKESALTLTLAFSLTGCFIGPIGLAIVGQSWVNPAGTPTAAVDTWMLAGVGITGFLGQVLLNRGMALAPTGPATAMRYADLLFSLIFQATVFHTPPNALKLVGVALVLSVIFAIIDRQRRLAVAKRKALEAMGTTVSGAGVTGAAVAEDPKAADAAEATPVGEGFASYPPASLPLPPAQSQSLPSDERDSIRLLNNNNSNSNSNNDGMSPHDGSMLLAEAAQQERFKAAFFVKSSRL